MKEYTAKEMKLLKANPYTFKVTKHKLYFTAVFKEAFWRGCQAGNAPRKPLEDLGMFGQKQIDSMVQSIKRQAQSGYGFSQGQNRSRRMKDHRAVSKDCLEGMERVWNEVKYLRQEVEFLKKLLWWKIPVAEKSHECGMEVRGDPGDPERR